MHSKEFFIRKAIGWSLRQYARTNPKWVIEFVNQYDKQLSGLSKREALKHL
jgi:3-methyladenine DNA glycosylase AlkD